MLSAIPLYGILAAIVVILICLAYIKLLRSKNATLSAAYNNLLANYNATLRSTAQLQRDNAAYRGQYETAVNHDNQAGIDKQQQLQRDQATTGSDGGQLTQEDLDKLAALRAKKG